jgi:hypothetical protein
MNKFLLWKRKRTKQPTSLNYYKKVSFSVTVCAYLRDTRKWQVLVTDLKHRLYKYEPQSDADVEPENVELHSALHSDGSVQNAEEIQEEIDQDVSYEMLLQLENEEGENGKYLQLL